uniref:Uncharacterized protein n=1 Tax=Timema cristinae TaxID=61476 RepID=A0A7R9CCW5_TIMCR|nr:unnamed protein product [Timema cristinae]
MTCLKNLPQGDAPVPSTTTCVRIPTRSTTLRHLVGRPPREICKPARDCMDVSGRTFSRMFCTWRCRNLAIGIGIQNFPEGLAVSLPLKMAGFSTWKSFWKTIVTSADDMT